VGEDGEEMDEGTWSWRERRRVGSGDGRVDGMDVDGWRWMDEDGRRIEDGWKEKRAWRVEMMDRSLLSPGCLFKVQFIPSSPPDGDGSGRGGGRGGGSRGSGHG
jgi:hypothetical protein